MEKHSVQFEIQNAAKTPFLHEELKAFRQTHMDKVRELSKLNPAKMAATLAADWGLIAGTIFLSEMFFHPVIYLLSLCVIAGRQHALLATSHEGAHYRIANQPKLNDWLSDHLAAFPIFFCTEGYRENHLKHHRYLNTDQDPDWARKIGQKQWQFPKSKKELLRSLPSAMFWHGLAEWVKFTLLVLGLYPFQTLRTDKAQQKRLYKRLPFYAAAFTSMTLLGGWSVFFMYWMVPFLFIYPSFQRIRSVSEHFGLDHTHELNQTRNVLASGFERLFLAPNNVNYHLAHHLFPSVPAYNLEALQKVLMSDEFYRIYAHQNESYLWPTGRSVLDDITDLQGSSENTPKAA